VKKQDILENQVSHAYLAIGSNLGRKIHNIEVTKFELEKFKIKILRSSSYYMSESWPDNLMPNYINIILQIETSLRPLELLEACNIVELKMGRIRIKKNSPRTCDIDIIDYDNKVLGKQNSKLILPHPRMCKRNFVLLPLYELDKSWIHPIFKINIVNLINSLPIKDLRSIKKI
jgi:2-amino-4-hydroxy-6-hydroxymethyldihydropteridine diphosphokinase